MKMNVYKFLPWIVLSFLLTSCRQFQGKNSNAQADEKCSSVSNIQLEPKGLHPIPRRQSATHHQIVGMGKEMEPA